MKNILCYPLSQDGCIAVIVCDLSGNLEEHLTSLFNTVRIQLISEKEECWIEVNCDTYSEQVYMEVGRIFNHASSKVQIYRRSKTSSGESACLQTTQNSEIWNLWCMRSFMPLLSHSVI